MNTVQVQALSNAMNNQSIRNYAAIYQGFEAKGLQPDDIVPRSNIFTFHAWKALGRQVRKGEHGVKVLTYVAMTKTDKETGKTESFRRPRSTTVFHISQTDPLVIL